MFVEWCFDIGDGEFGDYFRGGHDDGLEIGLTIYLINLELFLGLLETG